MPEIEERPLKIDTALHYVDNHPGFTDPDESNWGLQVFTTNEDEFYKALDLANFDAEGVSYPDDARQSVTPQIILRRQLPEDSPDSTRVLVAGTPGPEGYALVLVEYPDSEKVYETLRGVTRVEARGFLVRLRDAGFRVNDCAGRPVYRLI